MEVEDGWFMEGIEIFGMEIDGMPKDGIEIDGMDIDGLDDPSSFFLYNSYRRNPVTTAVVPTINISSVFIFLHPTPHGKWKKWAISLAILSTPCSISLATFSAP